MKQLRKAGTQTKEHEQGWTNVLGSPNDRVLLAVFWLLRIDRHNFHWQVKLTARRWLTIGATLKVDAKEFSTLGKVKAFNFSRALSSGVLLVPESPLVVCATNEYKQNV